MKLLSVFTLCALGAVSYGRVGFGPGEQEWGFETVRPGANMFWWLYYTTADVTDYTERPLVIWLQGGPGASSTGFGNFEELGPLDSDLNPRENSWVKNANVMFIDNPVGTGFSYVDSNSLLATTNQEIADDLVEMMRGFYEKLPQFKTVPLVITAESYGGKMTVDFALALNKAIKNGNIECNLVGVGLGDSWISPIDSVLTWAPYLYYTNVVDKEGQDYIQAGADDTKQLLDAGRFEEATDGWGDTEYRVLQVSGNVDFYNILKKIPGFGLRVKHLIKPGTKAEADLDRIMNVDVRQALGIEQSWQDSSSSVFSALYGDFMKPVTDRVELLLNTTDVKVAVFNGQLDLIVDTPGTIAWVERLNWIGSSKWHNAARNLLVVDGIIEGYVKSSGNFAFYWVDRAGHMVPADNPAAMDAILRDLTDNYTGTRKQSTKH